MVWEYGESITALATSGRAVDLAPTDEARVGLDPHQQRVLRTVGARPHLGQPEVDGLDIGDLHGCVVPSRVARGAP